jgi:O-antigen/teichoic acid export membrane protein
MLKEIAKDSLIYGFGNFLFKGISFAVFLVYANIFTVEDFGKMELVITLAGLVAVVMNLGINNGVQRFYFDKKENKNNKTLLVSTGLWALIFWSTIITFFSILIVYGFEDLILGGYKIPIIFFLLAFLANIPAQLFQYSLDILRLEFSPWKFTILSAIRYILTLIVSLWFVLILGLDLIGVFLGSFIALYLSVPIAFYVIRKNLGFYLDKLQFKELVKFGYPFIFVGLAYWIFNSVDRWMLGSMTNLTQVGLYSIASKFSYFLVFINTAFAQAWPPIALKLYGENENYKHFYSKIFSYWFFGLAIIGISLSLFAYEILVLFTPQEYWKAATILGILSIGIVFFGTTQITMLGLSIEKKTNIFSLVTWITAITNIILNLIFIPFFQALGAAIATLLSYLVLTVLYLYWSQKIHPIPIEKKKILYSSSIIIITLFLLSFINNINWSIHIFLIKAIFVFIFLLLAYKIRLIPKLYDFNKLML